MPFSRGPLYTIVSYTVAGLSRTMSINLAFNGNPSELFTGGFYLRARDNSEPTANTYLTTFIGFAADLCSADTTFVGAEVFYQPTVEAEPEFVETVSLQIDGGAGGRVLSEQLRFGSQETYSFKTALNNPMKVVLMESLASPHVRQPQASVGAPQDLVDFLLGDGSCHVGRDGSYPARLTSRTVTYNQKTVKERYGVG